VVYLRNDFWQFMPPASAYNRSQLFCDFQVT